MPCYEPDRCPPGYWGGYSNPPSNPQVVYRDNPQVVELLCSACRALARMGYDMEENPELSKWWTRHQMEDEAKEKAVAARKLKQEAAKEISKKPFNTLTPEEKELLKSQGYL